VSSIYQLRESDKHFLWSLLGATGIIFFWRGIWEGFGALPILEEPFVSLFIGLAILTFSGIILKEFDPLGGLEQGTLKILNSVQAHPQRNEFRIRYLDKVRKKEIEFKAAQIRRIEKNIIHIHERGKEIFIPIHRVRAIHRNGKRVWRF